MKIKRIKTLSFAISEEHEQDIEKKFRKSAKKGILGIGFRENANILRSYLPIAKFEVTHIKNIGKGGISQKSEELIGNSFHTDLSSGEIYCIQRNRIVHYDILRKLLDLPPETVKTLGYLFMHGETLREKLDENAVLDVARRGLIRIFKPRMLQISSLIVDEISNTERKTQVRDRVKVAFHIPRFDYAGYNLSGFLATTNTIVESYIKEPMRFSVEQISKTLEYFFDATVSLEAVIFLPSMRCEYIQKNQSKKLSGQEFPVCFLHEKITRYKEGVKLKPISLSTELLAAETIPVERSTINFSDVGNLDEIKEEIRREIIYPIVRPDLAKDFGKRSGGSILLYGPPGCGKTYIAIAAIGECGASFFNVNISDIISSGAENGPRILHEIFNKACKNSPSIVFFDEIEAIGGKKGTAGYIEKILIDQLLTEMDGVESMKENVLFIGATNAPWAIDPALRRSGRFTKQIFLPPPDLNAKIEIFKIHTRDEPLSKDIDFKKLAELTEDYSSADIKAICDSAAEIPWEEALKGNPEREITMSDFLNAISKQKSSIISWFDRIEKDIKVYGEKEEFKDLLDIVLKFEIKRSRKSEILLMGTGEKELEPGAIYLIEEEKLEKGIEFFMGALSGNTKGFYITREHPDGVNNKYNLMNTQIIWLSSTHDYSPSIDPIDLIELSHSVREFITDNKNSVILLDGIEYLVTQNGYEPVLKLLQSINDIIAFKNSRMIVSINPMAFSTQQLALIERECKKIL